MNMYESVSYVYVCVNSYLNRIPSMQHVTHCEKLMQLLKDK